MREAATWSTPLEQKTASSVLYPDFLQSGCPPIFSFQDFWKTKGTFENSQLDQINLTSSASATFSHWHQITLETATSHWPWLAAASGTAHHWESPQEQTTPPEKLPKGSPWLFENDLRKSDTMTAVFLTHILLCKLPGLSPAFSHILFVKRAGRWNPNH